VGGRKRRAGYLCPGQFQFVTPRAVAITPPSLADLRRDLSFQAVFAGFLTVFVGLAGTVTLLFQAAQTRRPSHDQTASWLLASCILVGVTGVLLSWRFRAPVVTAYALPGIVLLIHAGGQFAYAEVIGTLIVAGLSSGVFYLLAGLSGGVLAGVFVALSASLVQVLARLALIATILNSLTLAMQEPRWREAAVLTVLVTASGLSVLGIGSAFWGLVVGALSAWLLGVGARRRGEAKPESVPPPPPSLEAQPLKARPPEIQPSAQETVR